MGPGPEPDVPTTSLPCLLQRDKKAGPGSLLPGGVGAPSSLPTDQLTGARLSKGFMEDGHSELDKRQARTLASFQTLSPFAGR